MKNRNEKGQFIKGHSLGVRFGEGQSRGDNKKYRKISIAQKGKKKNWKHHSPPPIHFGEKNWNWKGGITPVNEKIRKSLQYKKWRKAVFERDNYTCVWCGDNKGGNLEADHIKPFAYFPELRFDINNGRTLCHECHQKTDTYLSNIFSGTYDGFIIGQNI